MAVAAAVGEAFLSGFIEVVLDRLASPQVVDLIRGKKVDVNLVQRLKNTLYAVEVVLNDAEQKQFKDSAVNKWLDDLKDAVYVADDILDHISTKAAISNNNKVSPATATNYFSRLFNFKERDMVCKLEDIVARLEYILKYKDILGLQHIATDHSSWRTPSTSLVDVGSNIFATLLGGEFYLRREELANETKIGTMARHLSFSKFSDPVHENYDVFGQAKHLRTFFAINFDAPPFNNEKAPSIILSNLKCLRVLSFRRFHLDALPDSIESNKVALHELPQSLEVLNIQGTQIIKSVFEAIAISLPTSLQRLHITDCSSAISFPGDCLPTSLKELSITKCKYLNFPKQIHQHESLQSLTINGSCDSLSTIPLDNLPNLDRLQIYSCENIEHLSASKIPSNLVVIYISTCPKFVSFPIEGLSAPSLKSLYIDNCTNLKSLPCHINTLLPKLQDVRIFDCPEMETFPEGGMPASLRSLILGNCEKLLRNPSLTSLDMLTHLYIGGPCDDAIKSFPNKGFALLPPSLTSLYLWKISSLHTLDCTGLLHLQQLEIVNCPQLENMEGERLPASLIKLQIIGCPLLGERKLELEFSTVICTSSRMYRCKVTTNISFCILSFCTRSNEQSIHTEHSVKEKSIFPRSRENVEIDNNQSPRFPGKIEESTNVMQGVNIFQFPRHSF
ncbi:hypothetical protein P8452_15592 [Trifolium repens]|nr:hypothetical protein P8452_15592 [Trifolium repens]